ncbi:hypothetical protein [Pseudomonas sp. RIT-PI-AD]|uniref:hypothetical protein n=1 Tax=Pseudomonas sp. RIT-PI-AD TaxID=3035294 RepID=UPI0021D7DFCC|nr:hypothetical protein [Pseudomonas sp. RIT-PI-AD]
MNECEILFPTPQVVTVCGRSVQIKCVEFQNFELFSETAQALVAAMANMSVERFQGHAGNAQNMRAILRKCTNLSRWRVRRLPAPVVLQLVTHVVRVNIHFFDLALADLARLMAGQMQPSN